MVRSNPRKPRRRASSESVEFEALLDPVDAAPHVVEPVSVPLEPAIAEADEPMTELPEPAGDPELVIEVPPAVAPSQPPPSRFDAAGTDDDRLPVYSKRARRRR